MVAVRCFIGGSPRCAAVAVALLVICQLGSRASASESPSGLALITLEKPTELQGSFPGLFANFSAASPSGSVAVWLPISKGDDVQGCSPPSRSPVFDQPFVVVFRRGTCAFGDKVLVAHKMGAVGVLIVGNGEDLLVMGGELPPGSSMVVLNVQKSLGDQLFTWSEDHADGEPIIATISKYEANILDFSEALIVLLGTALVAAGSWTSTSDLRQGSPLAPQQEEVLEVDQQSALFFFVFGSCMLVVLFFLMKYLIYVIIFGFCTGGASCITTFGSTFLQHFFPSMKKQLCVIPNFGPVARSDALAMVPAVACTGCWLWLRNAEAGWIFQDIMGAGFLCMIQRTIRLPNIKIATVFLSAMFFFDIFWVFISPRLFGQSVMVAVATGGGTGETVPMLLRIPAVNDPLGSDRMLGFGDIALPGMLVAHLRRYDLQSGKRWFRGYFTPVVIGYFFGLCATICALVIMRMGQPALLYLVPGTLGTTLVLSWCRGDLAALWDGETARSPAITDDGNSNGMSLTEALHSVS